MYFSTYFPFSLRGDVAIFLFWFGWGFVELVDIVAFVFHDTAWTLVKPQWRLFKAFGGGRGRICHLGLYSVGFGAYPVGFGFNQE